MLDLTFSMRDLELFLLILVRVIGFVGVAPFFAMSDTPMRVKVGIGFMVAVLIYQRVDVNIIEYSTVFGYAILVIKEATTGILIGFSAAICTAILSFAGQLVDMDIGLSMVSLFDPVSRESVTISSTYYNYAVTLMMLISGLYQFLLAAIVESFRLIPVTGAVFSSEKIVSTILAFLRDYLALGFRLCLPVFAAMILLNAILGILTKVSPQLNMFAIGIQLKMLIGLGILFLTVGMLPTVSTLILSEVKKMVTLFTEALI